MSEWKKITYTPEGVSSAPENVPLLTIISDEKGLRNEAVLTRRGGVWCYPDMSMYVYYTPTHFKEVAHG